MFYTFLNAHDFLYSNFLLSPHTNNTCLTCHGLDERKTFNVQKQILYTL